MSMSEYMSRKTLEYQEAEFRRELERRRILHERLAERESEAPAHHPRGQDRGHPAGQHGRGSATVCSPHSPPRGGARSASAKR